MPRRPPPALRAWRNATFVVFAVAGTGFATWASRIPATRDELQLSTVGVAVLLGGISIGSVAGLVLAPVLIRRTSGRRALTGCTLGFCLSLVVAGLGVHVLGSVAVAFAALVAFGVCFSATDVLMNVEGAMAEKALGRTVLPLMHAFFSLGTMVGAGLGAIAVQLGAGVAVHFAAVTVVLAGWTLASAPRLPGEVRTSVPDAPAAGRRPARRRLRIPERLRDRRLLAIGLVVTGMALTEGAANDWIALAAVDGHGTSESGGALVFGAFVLGMTLARVAGGPLLDRYGRAEVLAATAACGLVGVVLFILAPSGTVVVHVSAVLWGVGASMGFPVGMSAAAEHPTDGPRRVSIIGVFGYGSFLLGPPVIGVLADHVGLLHAFYLVAALLVVSLVLSPSTRSTAQPAPAGRA
ncbi:MFS transporter [Nocardioides sp. C4-1]|uniref:MFS transporter n=1 Tax=Nocardioides sp. C4-1 TaxID=3151851 RepID=UPI0032674385